MRKISDISEGLRGSFGVDVSPVHKFSTKLRSVATCLTHFGLRKSDCSHGGVNRVADVSKRTDAGPVTHLTLRRRLFVFFAMGKLCS